MKKVCLISDTHGLYDSRIYHKIGLSLHKAGYEVHYVFVGLEEAEGMTEDGIHYYCIKQRSYSSNRYLNFIVKTIKALPSKELYAKAVAVNADVYHFHDLWINKFAIKLKKLPHNPKIIYDVHESFATDFRGYNPSFLNFLLSYFIEYWEKRKAKRYDCIITVVESITQSFEQKSKHSNVHTIYNYSNLKLSAKPLKNKEFDFIYCGGITERRCLSNILESIKILRNMIANVKIVFVGPIFEQTLNEKIKDFILLNELEKNIIFVGKVSYSKVGEYYEKSKIGLNLLTSIESNQSAIPIKLFEYLNFGIPIIGSDFGLASEIIMNDEVGICVNANNPVSISNAMSKLLFDKKMYSEFSHNAMQVAKNKYQWKFMEEKLLKIYSNLLK